MRRFTSVALVFLLLFSLGCVAEKDVSVPENEKVLSASAGDLDLDTVTDSKKYVFRPLIIDAGQNIMMQKSVSAAQIGTELNVKSTKALSPNDVSRLETLILEFENGKKEKERQCKDELGISGAMCASPAECAEGCKSAGCQKYGYASEALGYWIYKFGKDLQALSDYVSDMRNLMIIIKDATPQEKEVIMKKLNSILDKTIEINNNPLLSENMFAVCAPIDYNNNKIKEMLTIMGQYERVPSAYEYVVNVKFVVSGKDYTELQVTDSVPQAMLLTLQNISLVDKGSGYDREKNEISWEPLKLNFYPEYIIGYSFVSSQNMREDIFANWPTPRVSTRVISLSKSPTLSYLYEASKNIYGITRVLGYYPALAIVLGFWDILFFSALFVGRIGYAFIQATQSKTGVMDNIMKVFGGANPHWREYAIAYVVFIVLGYVAMFIGAPVSEDSLNVDSIGRNILENPFGALSLLFFFLSFHAAYSIAEDRVKGLIVGRKYYENIIDLSPKANRLRYQKLQEKMAELTAVISAAKNLDVSEERNALITVPAERIEAILSREGGEKAVKELIEAYTAKVENAIVRVHEKMKITEQYWPEWKKEIADKVSQCNLVSFTSLTNIPPEWRLWAASKYVAENPGEDLVVENETIKSMEVTPEAKADHLLKRLVTNGLAVGGAVLKPEGIMAMSSSVGNKAVESVLAWKVSNYAKTLGQRLFGSPYRAILIVGSKNAVIFVKGAEKEGAVFAPIDKVKDAFLEFEGRLRKI